ncbi:replication initiator 1-like [Rhipicephalus sanguineus]|uniref:replication initiator 1-like n=1 Tax=Rhipicephalus sanguineus TaxID=34632 RepID=UPI0020C3D5B7|nr:replication initiator 1-like [Rhipicephalus sanguineus]
MHTAIFPVSQQSDCPFLKLEKEQDSIETTTGYHPDGPQRTALQKDCSSAPVVSSSVVFCDGTGQGKVPLVLLERFVTNDAEKPDGTIPSQEEHPFLPAQPEWSVADQQSTEHTGSGVTGVRASGPLHPQQQQALPQNTHSSNRKQFRCPMCRKTFKWKANLQGHIRVHTGEKPFQCPYCSRSFSDRSNAKRHMLTHISPAI